VTLTKKPEKNTIHRVTARREMLDIVKTCEAIEDRRFNPFLLDVRYALSILGRYFPHWKELEDHCLDAKALNHLSRVLRLQGSQLRFQSSSLYADPSFLEEKLPTLSTKKLAEVFAESWHPVVELEQVTVESVSEAITYWNTLAPIEERWKRFGIDGYVAPGSLEVDKLRGMGVKAQELFQESLLRLWRELLEKSRSNKVDYPSFVCRESFAETIERALLVSFLITYGYARMIQSKGAMWLIPNEKQKIERRPISLPISINHEVWSKWKESTEPSVSMETK